MRLLPAFAAIISVPTLLVNLVSASAHEGFHAERAKHRRLAAEVAPHDLTKRDFSNARFTYYNIETGNQVACGGFHSTGDFVCIFFELRIFRLLTI